MDLGSIGDEKNGPGLNRRRFLRARAQSETKKWAWAQSGMIFEGQGSIGDEKMDLGSIGDDF